MDGAGAPRPGPALEPSGILSGRDAAAAIQAGFALPLAGGPCAFTLVQTGNQQLPIADARHLDLTTLTTAPPPWAGIPATPAIMAIVNVTPDSFSDGGDHPDPTTAIEAALRMHGDGATILDVGGESTRPGAAPVTPAQEQARILPVIAALARAGACVSVDTRNAPTMRTALDAGARIVNDVSALAHDPEAAPLLAARATPVILMHMRGTPATMRDHAHYVDVAAEVRAELAARIATAEAAGIPRAAIAVDPGFGFAKGAAHNVELLRRLPLLATLGCRIVVGLSRKATIGALAHEPDPKRRLPGSLAAALFALDRGATILRVHDAAATRQALAIWTAMAG